MAIQQLHEAYFVNDGSKSIEIMIPKGERVRVFHSQDRFHYDVDSPEHEQQSVVLDPGERLELL